MLMLRLTVFTIFVNAHAFQSGSILNDMDPYAGIVFKSNFILMNCVQSQKLMRISHAA